MVENKIVTHRLFAAVLEVELVAARRCPWSPRCGHAHVIDASRVTPRRAMFAFDSLCPRCPHPLARRPQPPARRL